MRNPLSCPLSRGKKDHLPAGGGAGGESYHGGGG